MESNLIIFQDEIEDSSEEGEETESEDSEEHNSVTKLARFSAEVCQSVN